MTSISDTPGASIPQSATKLGLLLNAASIASVYRSEIVTSLQALAATGKRKPKLCGILSTNSAPSKWYADFTRKHCEDIGVEFDLKVSSLIVEGFRI
jgi:methylenetetrahydrofolate dehydrogenase (NAD+)